MKLQAIRKKKTWVNHSLTSFSKLRITDSDTRRLIERLGGYYEKFIDDNWAPKAFSIKSKGIYTMSTPLIRDGKGKNYEKMLGILAQLFWVRVYKIADDTYAVTGVDTHVDELKAYFSNWAYTFISALHPNKVNLVALHEVVLFMRYYYTHHVNTFANDGQYEVHEELILSTMYKNFPQTSKLNFTSNGFLQS